ncbi:MAG: sel1 repeat family protein [Mycoplasmataceae bacterium]|jgi:TPR repeat protein|nr:sel1 repeat family protein [Mycoplasmataceae bacterium]
MSDPCINNNLLTAIRYLRDKKYGLAYQYFSASAHEDEMALKYLIFIKMEIEKYLQSFYKKVKKEDITKVKDLYFAQFDEQDQKAEEHDNAIKYFESIAKEGKPVAFDNLSAFYKSDADLEKHNPQVEKYLESVIKHASPEILFEIGQLFEHASHGASRESCAKKSKKYYELAAKQSHPAALRFLADFYLHGDIHNKKNIPKAVEYYELSAKHGDPYSQFYVGYMHHHGENNVKQDHDRAMMYYLLSYKQGYVKAGNYLKGLLEEIEKNKAKQVNIKKMD